MAAEQLGGFSLSFPLLHDENQEVQGMGSTSFFKTCFNVLNALSGIGILSVPYALASGGWLSLTLLFGVAIATFYAGLLLQKCMEVNPNIRTYLDIGEQAFGRNGRLMVSIVTNGELYLMATGVLILEGDNLQNLFPIEGFEIFGQAIDGKQMFILISGLVVLPSVCFYNPNVLSYISATGVFACIIIVGSIVWAGALDGVGFHRQGTTLNWQGIPTAFSLFVVCYSGLAVFPTLYTPMRNKNQFFKVLLICFTFCTITYAAMGILGFLMFGSEVQSQLTLNLPTEKLSSRVIIYTTLVIPISKYALMVAPMVDLTEENCFPYYSNSRPFSLLIRTGIVFSSIFVALTVPFFGALMSLVGAFLGVTGSILLPCLCYLKISGIYQNFGIETVAIVGVVLMGIAAAIVGTYTSMVQILSQF